MKQVKFYVMEGNCSKADYERGYYDTFAIGVFNTYEEAKNALKKIK